MVKINPRLLLSIYLLVPLALLVGLVDFFSFHGQLKSLLPASPEAFLIFNLIFQQPHIMASLVTFADREYLKSYQLKLFICLAISLSVPILIPALWNRETLLVIILIWTTFHVLGQQIGLLAMFTGVRTKVMTTWKWIFMLFFTGRSIFSLFPQEVKNWVMQHQMVINLLHLLILLLFMVLTGVLYQQSKTSMGKKYLLANFLLCFAGAAFQITGYSFLAILIFRLIHDLTGFVFYISHDLNRNREKTNNAFYKLFKKVPTTFWWMSPFLGILLAAPLTYFSKNNNWASYILLVCVILHYTLESSVWKSGSLHRKQIQF